MAGDPPNTIPSNRRYDCFISFHGDESLSSLSFPFSPQFPTMRHFAEFLHPRLSKLPNQCRRPKIFLDSVELPGRISHVFDAIAQLRGGGVGLILLTTKYLQRKYCLAELRSMLDYARLEDSLNRRSEAIVLRVVCLQPDFAGRLGRDILLDAVREMERNPLAASYINGLSEFQIHTVPHDVSAEATALHISKLVWHYWEGPSCPVLGEDKPKSFNDMRRFFVRLDVPLLAKELYTTNGPDTELEHVFRQAQHDDTLSYDDIRPLYNVYSRCKNRDAIRASLASYTRKWLSQDWSWVRPNREERRNFLTDAEQAGQILPRRLNRNQLPILGPPRVPPAGEHLVLEFENPNTPEGQLLQAVRGTCRFVAAIGDGGMGKTSALVRLRKHRAVRDTFTDSIFLEFGRAASLDKQTEALVAEAHALGATIPQLDPFGEKDDAMYLGLWCKVAQWLAPQKLLIVLDDLWASANILWRAIQDFARILNDVDSKCRVVLSTREIEVTRVVPSVNRVRFEHRESLGESSKLILAKYAQCSHSDLHDASGVLHDAVNTVLQRCHGMPLTLGVAGGLARQQADLFDCNVTAIWLQISNRIQNTRVLLDHEPMGGVGKYPSYFRTINASLEAVDDLAKARRPMLQKKPSQLFIALAVLREQDVIPATSLQLLWCLEDISDVLYLMDAYSNASLATQEALRQDGDGRHILSYHDRGLRIHDLVHEFCTYKAKSNNDTRQWAKNMLCSSVTGEDGRHNDLTASVSVDDWLSSSLVLERYIEENEIRLFLMAGMESQIIRIVHDYRWLLRWRNKIDIRAPTGVTPLIDKYKACAEALQNSEDALPLEIEVDDVLKALRVMETAIRLGWNFVRSNPAELLFQLYGRLKSCGSRLRYIQMFLETVDMFAKDVWARPLSPILLPAGGRVTAQLECDASICISLLPGSSEILATGKKNISVVDLHNGSVTDVLRDEEKPYENLAGVEVFSKRACAYGIDGFLRFWNLEAKTFDARVDAHPGGVKQVAISRNEEWIVSIGADHVVRRWKAKPLREVRRHWWQPSIYLEGVQAVAIDPSSKWFVCGCNRGHLYFWWLTSGNEKRRSLPIQGQPNLSVSGLHVLADGHRVLVGTEVHGVVKVEMWDLRTNESLWRSKTGGRRSSPFTTQMPYCVVEMRNRLFLDGGFDRPILEICLEEGSTIRAHMVSDNSFQAFRVRGGRELIVGGQDLVSVYDLRVNETLDEQQVSALDASIPTYHQFLVFNELSMAREEVTLRASSGSQHCRAASSETASEEIWRFPRANGRYNDLELCDPSTLFPKYRLSGPIVEHSGGIAVVAVSSSNVIAAGYFSGFVHLWEVDVDSRITAQTIEWERGSTVLGLTFSRSGKSLASWGDGDRIKIWDIESKCLIGKVPVGLDPYSIRVTMVADRGLLLLCGNEKEPEYWSLQGQRRNGLHPPRKHKYIYEMRSDQNQPVAVVIGRWVYWVSETSATIVATLPKACGHNRWNFNFRNREVTIAPERGRAHVAKLKIENG